MKRFSIIVNVSTVFLWLFSVSFFLVPSFTVTAAAAADGGDKCASSDIQFQCPNPDACPDSGYSLVSSCMDCHGHLSSFYKHNQQQQQQQCFDRKLLSRKGNPSTTYFYRDLIGIIVWFLAAGVGTFKKKKKRTCFV
jgi:hypothetical protein